jgi:hypothetical protein
MATKFDWDSYFQPTPKLIRKIGDTFLGVGSALSTTTLITALNTDDAKMQKILTIVGISTIVLTAVGKFLSNFFKEESDDVQQ